MQSKLSWGKRGSRGRKPFLSRKEGFSPPGVPSLSLRSLNFSSLGQGDLGSDGAYELVDQGCAENDGLNARAELRQLRKHHLRHTDGHAGLRQKRDAEVFADVGGSFDNDGTEIRAEIFAEGAHDDVEHAEQADGRQRADVQLRTGDDEEEHEQRRGPSVADVHDLERVVAEVGEHRAHGHAHEQIRQAELLCDGHAEHNAGDADAHLIGAGMEKAHRQRDEEAEQSAGQKRERDFNQRRDGHRIHARLRAGGKRIGDSVGNGEDDQADGVVHGDDGQQRVGQLALSLVLAHDHERRGRGGRRGDCAEDDRLGHVKPAQAQHDIDQRGGHD